MKIKFKYNKAVDKKCWKRWDDFIKKNGDVWGVKREINRIIDIKYAEFTADTSYIVKEYEKVFGIKVKIDGYVVTTPFSMINDGGKIEKGGVVYYSIYTSNPSVVLAHEIFHIFFEKYTQRKIANYDEAKEYFTVLINDIFDTDVSKGYPKHEKQRKKVLATWRKSGSIDRCIELFQ